MPGLHAACTCLKPCLVAPWLILSQPMKPQHLQPHPLTQHLQDLAAAPQRYSRWLEQFPSSHPSPHYVHYLTVGFQHTTLRLNPMYRGLTQPRFWELLPDMSLLQDAPHPWPLLLPK